MHHFKAKGGTHFNFNSDMSGDVQIHKMPNSAVRYVSGPDLLEFARWYAVEYAGVSSEPVPTPPPSGQLDWLWMVTDPSPVSELGDILFQPGDRLQDWCVGCAASKRGIPAATLHADEGAARVDAMGRIAIRDAASELRRALALMGSSVIDSESRARVNEAIDGMERSVTRTPAEPPTRRPARDVAHDILEKSGWAPGCGVSLVEAADAIVAIIRADRKGGQ